MLAGCTSVVVDKPDGTKVTVTTWGSSQVTDMQYARDGTGITLSIGSTSNTPDGMAETIDAVGSAIADATTAGVSSAGSAFIGNLTDKPVNPKRLTRDKRR
jgi:hypothetical protein